MTVVERTSDIFNTEMRVIAHGVNCEGVMGAGIARTIRQLYPFVYDTYKTMCDAGNLSPGHILFVQDEASNTIIANLATQDYRGANARLEWVTEAVARLYNSLHWNSDYGVAFPQIGCGIGGLDWDVVNPVIRGLSQLQPHGVTELWTLG